MGFIWPSVAIAAQVLTDFEGTNKGELVMDVELLEAFDDEADQGYYEDETVSAEQLQEIVQEAGPFSAGKGFEKLPGQMPLPMDGAAIVPSELPGQLGQDIGGSG